jgi:hypothetical protein
MNKVIVITLYNRPKQTLKLIEHLSRCYGIDNYRILINVDDNPQDREEIAKVLAIAEDFAITRPPWMTRIYHQEGVRRGVDGSKIFLLQKAYRYTDFTINFEDDTWPSPNTLWYFEWNFNEFGSDNNLFSITGYNYHHKDANINDFTKYNSIDADRWDSFCCWIWGMPKAKYEEVYGIDGCKYVEAHPDVNNYFDTWAGDWMKDHPSSYSLRPPLSHTMLLDAFEGATHTPSQEWFEDNEKTWIHRGLIG